MPENHYPTKQVIVMRTDLNMRKGKMVAQGSHAAMAFLSRNLVAQDVVEHPGIYQLALTKVELEWLDASFAKICVGVGSLEELDEVIARAKFLGVMVHEIQDNGTTEFRGQPTKTCAAIGPDWVELVDEVTGGLKLL